MQFMRMASSGEVFAQRRCILRLPPPNSYPTCIRPPQAVFAVTRVTGEPETNSQIRPRSIACNRIALS